MARNDVARNNVARNDVDCNDVDCNDVARNDVARFFQSVDGEPPWSLPPRGSHAELVEAYPVPTGRLDTAVADGGLICLGSSVLHRRRVVEMGGWKTARHLGYAEDSPSLPGAFSATA